MRRIALIIGFFCSLPLWGQAYKETLGTPISFNNILVTDNRNKNTAYAATITVTDNVAMLTEKGALAAQVGDTVTLTAKGGSQNPPDPSLLGTFTLLTVNNIAGLFTYNDTSRATYSYEPSGGGTFDSNPNVRCSHGKLLMTYSESSAANNPGTRMAGHIMFRQAQNCTDFPPAWGAPLVFYYDQENDCYDTSNQHLVPCDQRVPVLHQFTDGSLGLTWFNLNFGGSGGTHGSYPMYSRCPADMDCSNRSNWTKPARLWVPNPRGKLSWTWCGPPNSGAAFRMPDGSWAMTMSGTATAGPRCLQVNTDMYLVLSYDNGQSWGTQNNSIRLIHTVWPTNEGACSNSGGNNIMCFWRVNPFGGASGSRPSAMLWYFHSPDAGTTWPDSFDSGIPPSSRWTNRSMPADYGISPQLSCPPSPSPAGCTLSWYERFANVGQFGVMRMLTFSPLQAISNGAAYFASLTPSELWNGPPGDGLDGYQSTYWVDATHFYIWWQAQPVNSYAPLNIHQAAGNFVKY